MYYNICGSYTPRIFEQAPNWSDTLHKRAISSLKNIDRIQFGHTDQAGVKMEIQQRIAHKIDKDKKHFPKESECKPVTQVKSCQLKFGIDRILGVKPESPPQRGMC